jgi:hypothetical protein
MKIRLQFYGATFGNGRGLLIIETSGSHSDTPQSVGLLWTSDQHDAESSTLQDSNPQPQQAIGRRPKP